MSNIECCRQYCGFGFVLCSFGVDLGLLLRFASFFVVVVRTEIQFSTSTRSYRSERLISIGKSCTGTYHNHHLVHFLAAGRGGP